MLQKAGKAPYLFIAYNVVEYLQTSMARLSSQYSNKLDIRYIHYISVPYFLIPFCIFFILLLYF